MPQDYDRVMETYRKAFHSNETMSVEFRCNRGDKDPWRLFLMRGIEEQPDRGGYICAVIDITKMKAAKLAERREAEEAKDRKQQQERFIDMVGSPLECYKGFRTLTQA